MAESISLYVSEQTCETIEDIAQERFGTTTQKSAIISECIRADMYYSMQNEVDAETPIVSKAQQVPADEFHDENMKNSVVGLEHITEDASDKTTIRVSLPTTLVDYLDTHECGRGRTLDNCMRLYTTLLRVDVNEIQDDEEDEQQFEDVNEYLLKTDKSELSASGIDAHEVKESSKYRIPYLIGKLNDNYTNKLDIDRKDIDKLISDTFTVSDPTQSRYRKAVYESLVVYVLDIEEDNFIVKNIYSKKGKKAPASAGLNEIRVAQVINLADELLDSDEDKFDDVIQSYVDSYVDIEYEISDVIDDVIDVLQLYKSSEDLEYSFIDGRIDTVLLELKEF